MPDFAANAVRLQLHALAYNLGNFLRTLATPEPIKGLVADEPKGETDQDRCEGGEPRSATSPFRWPRSPSTGRCSRRILRLIAELRRQPPPAPA